jgi:competence protein ComFC
MVDRLASWPAPRRWLADAASALTSVFFPAGCRICDQLLTNASRVPICEQCLGSFRPLQTPICQQCGQPLQIPGFARTNESPGEVSGVTIAGKPAQGLVCQVCQGKTYAFDWVRSYANYQAALVRAIILLKFEQMEPLGAWFAARLAEIAKRQGGMFMADVVVPVPLHRQPERERGYNQADLIARPLARRLGLPYRAVLLVRTKPRPDKQVLTLEERWQSVRGAFATRPGSQVDNLRVLLVDDVMTTGATLDACARALREAGAKSVVGLTVARAARHPAVGSGGSNEKDAP